MMKRYSLFLAILLTCTAYTIAQPPGGGRGGPPGGPPPGQGGPGGEQHGGGPSNAVLAAIDADGDHTISAREISNSATALKKLDKNRDGQLTSDEIHAGGQQGQGGGRGERRGGGPPGQGGPRGGGPPAAPTAEQFMTHAMTFDADKDGLLSKVELQKMAAAVVEEMASRGGHGPEGGGRGGQGGGSNRQRPAIEE